ncbi:MAG: cytochrome c biogenesis CcdA family protein [Quisquiliibacterium sp.]|jgi:cytochrome c-type biogenesis protein
MVVGDGIQYGLSFVAGSLSTLSPCVFPLLPLVVGGVVHAHHHTGPLAMGLGMVTSFVITGVLVAAVGPSIGIDASHLRTAGAVMLIVIGLALLGLEFGHLADGPLSWLASLGQYLSDHVHPEHRRGAFVLGGLLGVIWSPCSGPLLGSGIAMVASQGDILGGALLFGVFGLGAATPLMFVSYASQSLFKRTNSLVARYGVLLRRIFAVAILLLGVSVLTDFDRYLERVVLDKLPAWWVKMTVQY